MASTSIPPSKNAMAATRSVHSNGRGAARRPFVPRRQTTPTHRAQTPMRAAMALAEKTTLPS